MKRSSLLGFVLASTFAASAGAQWQWVDKDGRKVFSDRPPPADVPQQNIRQQPHFTFAPPPSVEASAPAAGEEGKAAAPASKASGVDKDLQKKKAEQEAAEAAKRKAEETKNAKARAENCDRAKQAKASFDSGIPMRRPNAQGEMVFMDESARRGETQRLLQIIARDCGPAPKQ